MIKAVIFDIDNTLYNYDAVHELGMKALEKYCAQAFGIGGKEVHNCYSEAWGLAEKRIGTDTAAIHSRMLRFQCMTELWGQPLFPHVRLMYHVYWDTLMEHMKPAPGLPELLRVLKSRGVRIGIGTDMTAYIQYRKLEQLGIDCFIDRIVTSEEAGVEKPHPKLFELCVEKSGCRPEECVFIGDNIKKDVEGAISSGLHGIWYSQEKQPVREHSYPVIVSYRDCLRQGGIYLTENLSWQ